MLAKDIRSIKGQLDVALEEFNHDVGQLLSKRMSEFHKETGLHITDVQVNITTLRSVGVRGAIIESLPLAVRATTNAFD